MKWAKITSTLLHPVVMPTIGVLIYFIISPVILLKSQRIALFSVVFIATYMIPVFLLVLLKSLKLIKSYKVHTIQERKVPVLIMIGIFITIGKLFFDMAVTREISTLFMGTALGLIVIYFFFFKKIKASLHLLSFGSAIGFFLLLTYYNNKLIVFALLSFLLLLSGILAKARLILKAHTVREVYLGFFIGFFTQIITFLIYNR